jgi:hypothetical protein
MKLATFVFSIFWCISSIGAVVNSTDTYQSCLSSLREDGKVMLPKLSDGTGVVYQKKSFYDRDLYLIDSSKMYHCGELSIPNSSSTENVLNYEIDLRLSNKKYSLSITIPTDLTFGVEDFFIRDSSKISNNKILNCTEINSDEFDYAFAETVTSRMRSLPIQLEKSSISKKAEELDKVWGNGWKAKPVIDQERSAFLKVVKKCEKIPSLKNLGHDIKKKLIQI